VSTPIYDITPFSMLDYPEHLSAIIWFAGCNMRCSFCYNPEIVYSNGNLSVESVLSFLEGRQNRLEAVVLSGGEATLFKELPSLCRSIQAMGFKIKLDTNGAKPLVIKELLEHRLVDYIALDYKAPAKKFKEITTLDGFDQFGESLELILQSNIDYEVRTTLHKDLLSSEDINLIIEDLHVRGYDKTYYIQNFRDSETIGNLKESLNRWNKEEVSSLLQLQYR